MTKKHIQDRAHETKENTSRLFNNIGELLLSISWATCALTTIWTGWNVPIHRYAQYALFAAGAINFVAAGVVFIRHEMRK